MISTFSRLNPLTRENNLSLPSQSRPMPRIDTEELWAFMSDPTGARLAHDIKVDVNETDKAYTIFCDLPGFKRDDIKVSIDGDTVFLSAQRTLDADRPKLAQPICSERTYGHGSRTIRLAYEIDTSHADATYSDGVLCLDLPKKLDRVSSHQTLTIH
jgi:HSP20 family protein